MNREELRDFMIKEIKEKRPDMADKAEEMADFTLSLPSMQSEAGIKGFLEGYLNDNK